MPLEWSNTLPDMSPQVLEHLLKIPIFTEGSMLRLLWFFQLICLGRGILIAWNQPSFLSMSKIISLQKRFEMLVVEEKEFWRHASIPHHCVSMLTEISTDWKGRENSLRICYHLVLVRLPENVNFYRCVAILPVDPGNWFGGVAQETVQVGIWCWRDDCVEHKSTAGTKTEQSCWWWSPTEWASSTDVQALAKGPQLSRIALNSPVRLSVPWVLRFEKILCWIFRKDVF